MAVRKKTALVTSLILMLSVLILSSSETRAGVTNIREVMNTSRTRVVKLTSFETKFKWEGPEKKSTGAVTYGAIWSGDLWVPWADNADDFKGHFMTLEIIELRPMMSTDISHIYVLFQSGDYVRVNFYGVIEQRGFGTLTSGTYMPNAPKVPGEWRSGGDRRLVVFDKTARVPGFRFENIDR
jgi:hypothetical protein